VSAELFETSIVMISDVSVGLAQLLGNLRERISLKKMKSQGLSLVLGQVFYDLLPSIPAEEPFDSKTITCLFCLGRVKFNWFFRNSRLIESLRFQFSSAEEGLGISYLDYPRARRTFGTIEKRALSMNIEKYVLDKIVSFGTVSKNLVANASDRAGIPPKKQGQCLAIP
jgi:hypothetical protein